MTEKKVKVKFGTLDDFDFPETVYKYRYWADDYHKRFINNREVFMASAESFKDELDCRNPTRYDLLNKEQIYNMYLWSSKKENKHFSTQEHINFAQCWSKKSDLNHPERVKQHMETSVKSYHKQEGILSLTENWDNPKMWDIYADKGKGFCIGYDTRIMFEYLGGGGEVIYNKELPIIMPEPFMEPEIAMQYRVYCKTKKWEFEQEYRTKKFWRDPAKISDRQIELPKEAFKRVILGDSISEYDRASIEAGIKNNIGDIEIVERKNAK